MLISRTFLTYKSQGDPNITPSFFSKSRNFLSRYFFLLLFCLFKILDWKFDVSRQRTLNAKYVNKEVLHPHDSYFQSEVPRKRIHKSSFKRKDSEEDQYKEVRQAGDSKGKCRICSRKWRKPVLLKSSAYVYCKECLEKHVSRFESCPQTGVPAQIENIVKFFN